MLAFAVAAASGPLQARGRQSAPAQPPGQTALIKQYCLTCHNERMKAGGLLLDKADVASVSRDSQVWEKVVRKLRAGLMPPIGSPRPDRAAYDGLVSWLEHELDAAAARRPDPGRTEAVRRLNRTEYHNVIRDLLALDIDATELLPADNTSYGFDTIAGVLSVSPTLLDRYLSAARKISRLAVAGQVPSPTAETFRVKQDLPQNDRLDMMPLGTRGGTLIRYNFPVDAEYTIKVETAGAGPGTNLLEVTLDGERVQLTPVVRRQRGRRADPAADDYAPPIGSGQELRLAVKAGPREIGVTFIARTNSVTETLVAPVIKPNIGVTAGAAGFMGQATLAPRVEAVVITGPFNAGSQPVEDTPSRHRIFTCYATAAAEESACATKILTTLARRAYRRAPTDVDVQTLLTSYDTGRRDGGFEGGIESALRRLLMSPDFLFRIDRDPADIAPNTPYQIGDVDLASRLSFFIWGSIPDDELLGMALRGVLRKGTTLDQQVKRMLADPRSQSLVTGFAAQWLLLNRVDDWQVDPYAFPDFDEGLRQAMRRETELFVDSILRENRPVFELLTADYTFVNERLARHYNVPNVYGSQFRRIIWSAESGRRGLLGQGSVLATTSAPSRTSPVKRGKWILDNLLGTPPPPPPANVNTNLPEAKPGARVASIRERMQQHRANPVCASCHNMMDPLGLSLENFDATGRWRDSVEPNTPIDVSAAYFDGTKYAGPAGLRDALLQRPEQFVNNVVEKMLTYSLGRGLEFSDQPAVRAIRREVARNGNTLSSIVLSVAKSSPFQMRRSAS